MGGGGGGISGSGSTGNGGNNGGGDPEENGTEVALQGSFSTSGTNNGEGYVYATLVYRT